MGNFAIQSDVEKREVEKGRREVAGLDNDVDSVVEFRRPTGPTFDQCRRCVEIAVVKKISDGKTKTSMI